LHEVIAGLDHVTLHRNLRSNGSVCGSPHDPIVISGAQLPERLARLFLRLRELRKLLLCRPALGIA
jgi:hypothetical protein